MTYDNTMSFVLFRERDKKSEKSPDYTGSIELTNGRKFRLAAWLREGKNGKFLSGKVSEFEDRQREGEPSHRNYQSPHDQAKADGFQKQDEDDFDDDIPF